MLVQNPLGGEGLPVCLHCAVSLDSDSEISNTLNAFGQLPHRHSPSLLPRAGMLPENRRSLPRWDREVRQSGSVSEPCGVCIPKESLVLCWSLG